MLKPIFSSILGEVFTSIMPTSGVSFVGNAFTSGFSAGFEI